VDPTASFVVVAYGVADLNLGELPDGTPLVVVHNDNRLPEFAVRAPGALIRHVYPGGA
jgi:hypothetical protein